MKKIVLFFFATMLAYTINATVITVSNNPSNPGQYNDLQTAVDAASANDTLYVHGSGNNYGDVTVAKPLTIIGAGGLPNKNLPLETRISGIQYSFTSDGLSSGSGSRLYGCTIGSGGAVVFGNYSLTTSGINNIIISRNRLHKISFSSYYLYDNYLIENNIIDNFIGDNVIPNLNNFIVKNNVIRFIQSVGRYVAGGTWSFSNNIVLDRFIGEAANITNNIFYVPGAGNGNISVDYCTLVNNVFYSTGTAFDETAFNTGTSSGTGNFFNQNPDFVYYDHSAPDVFSYSFIYPSEGPFVNFNLSTSSPGKNAGTDGRDIGIYGGSTPYVEGKPAESRYRYFPLPAIPQMLDVTINNTSVQSNGMLNVNFKARKD
jgi:hypothetical protein